MIILEILKRALAWDSDDYQDMPDYATILGHLGLAEDDDPELIREAIEGEIDALEAEAEEAEAEPEGGDTDVGQ